MKKEFKVKLNDKETTFAVISPESEVMDKSEQIYAIKWREAVEEGYMLNAGVEVILRKGNLWNDALQNEQKEINKSIEDGEKKLLKGGMKLSEAKEVAIQLRRDRNRLRQLNTVWQDIQKNTAETKAENAKFNYLISQCVVYADTGNKYFSSFEDYLSRRDDPVAFQGATEFGMLYYGLDSDFQSKLPENKFLKNYGLCNDKLHLIDKSGNLIDTQGRRVDEYGRLLNEKNEVIDESGDAYTDEGELKVNFQPFLDDDGNAIEPV